MTKEWSPPPAPAACLLRPYPSTQKGGTLIASEVRDLAEHERRLDDPDLYRPESCPRCSSAVHWHDLRPRLMVGDSQIATEVLRFRCADRQHCGAAWQIVPLFLARCLWRSWQVVETAVLSRARSPVPARTRRRWAARLASTARLLIALLTQSEASSAAQVVAATGLDGSRADLIGHYADFARPTPGSCLAELAEWTHRLERGVRLM